MAETDSDMAALTEQQQLSLQQYVSVTDQDISAAVPLLRRCEWNVQIAIARFFDGEPAEPDSRNTAAAPAPEDIRRTETLANGWDDVAPRRRKISLEPAPRIAALPESQRHPKPPLLLSLALAPINIVLGLFSKLYSLVSYFLPFVPRLLDRLTAGTTYSATHLSTRHHRDPTSPSVTAFLETLKRGFGSHSLPFLQTTYARAYDISKKELRPLLVIPTSPTHSSTATFIRDILLSPTTITLLNNPANNLLLWTNSTCDSEAYRAATSLGVTSFPAAVLIAPIPSTTGSSAATMSISARVSGPEALSVNTFTSTIESALARHAPSLSRARNAKTEQDAVRNLREEQNSAYERSLAKDRDRARAKKETAEKAAREDQEQKDRAERIQRYARDLKQWRRWRASKISDEPGADVPATDVVRISIRLVNGERVIRKFSKGASLDEVYAFVACHAELKELKSESSEKMPLQPPKDFEHCYDFQLVSPMPRTVYAAQDSGMVGDRLGRSANLIAERVDDGDENED